LFGHRRPTAVKRSHRPSSEHLAISNNATEPAIRPLALGKTNYLLAAGDRAVTAYTLIENTKLNGLEPEPFQAPVLRPQRA
jgi:hypothetical protein